MAVVASCMLLFGMAAVAGDVLLPLWVTRELGYNASDWANLYALRRVGGLIGVVFLGALSDRLGARRMGALALFGVAGTLALLAFGPRQLPWIVLPFFGALVSTTFVNLDTLTQQVSERRQGLANTIYRSVGALAVVVTPLAATVLARSWNGYRPVFLLVAALVAVAGALLFRYPDDRTAVFAGGIWEVRPLLASWGGALRQRSLLRFLIVTNLWSGVLSGVNVFAAIHFTQQLGQSDFWFGLVVTMAGTAALLATIGVGFFLDRVSLRWLSGASGVLAGACAFGLGISDDARVAAALFMGFTLLFGMQSGPTSLWVSRATGAGRQIAAFSLHKLLNMLFLTLTAALVGEVARRVGVQAVFVGTGCVGMVISFAFWALPEPPRRST